MATGGVLGRFTVALGLDTTEFTGGLTKAEYQAQQFAANVGRTIGQGITLAVGAFAALATAGTAAFALINEQAEKIANFQDFADKVGDSAENFSKLTLAADISGVSLDTVAAASVKLTSSLSKTDDEGKNVGQALKAIGISFDDFKKLNPTEQLKQVADQFASFEDGAGKTAVAVALFGKAGAELIPFLNDLNEAGLRQNGLTADQIKATDDYTKAQARLRSELENFIQKLSADAIPALGQMQTILGEIASSTVVSETVIATLGLALKAAIVVFQTFAIVGANVAFVFQGVGREIGAIIAQIGALTRLDLTGFNAISEAVKADGVRARRELDKFEQRVMAVGQPQYMDDEVRRLMSRSNAATNPNRSAVKFTLASPATAKSGAADKTTEAQNALASYVKTLSSAIDKVNELTEVQKANAFLASLGTTGQQKEVRELVLNLAAEIDAGKEANRIIKERRDAIADEGEAVNKANDAYQSYIQKLLDGGPAAQLEKQRQIMLDLAEELTSGRISPEKYLDAVAGVLGDTNKELDKTKSFAEEVGLTFTSAFEDAINNGGKLRDVINGIGKDLLALGTRELVTNPLGGFFKDAFKNISTGGSSSGGGLLSGISSFFSGFFADGGFIPPGKWGIAGESGAEVIQGGNTGKTVIPMTGGGGAININYNAAPGQSRQSVLNDAAMLSRKLNEAQRNL